MSNLRKALEAIAALPKEDFVHPYDIPGFHPREWSGSNFYDCFNMGEDAGEQWGLEKAARIAMVALKDNPDE